MPFSFKIQIIRKCKLLENITILYFPKYNMYLSLIIMRLIRQYELLLCEIGVMR
jgi:hypothetical protein